MPRDTLKQEAKLNQLDKVWERLGGKARRADFRFDADFYRATYKDIASADIDPRTHYDKFGREEGRLPNLYWFGQFDKDEGIFEKLLRLIKDPELVNLLQKRVPGSSELAYELIALGGPVDRDISDFSSEYYLSTYTDVRDAGIAPLRHYLKFGYKENRHTLDKIRSNVYKGNVAYNANLPTCLISTHEFSKTGAPAVALDIVREAARSHNVIVMGCRGGALVDQFRDVSCHVIISSTPFKDWQYFDVPEIERVEFAIINSVESFPLVKPLVALGIPFIAYIHEFADYILPNYKSTLVALYADAIVFSSASVQLSWKGVLTDVEFDTKKHSRLLAQARLNFVPAQVDRCVEARDRLSSILGVDCGSRRIVYGAGQMQIRKGTDLFILTAQQVHEIDPDTLFIWIGDGANHEDVTFGVWLDKHMREAGVNNPNGNMFFIPAGPQYNDVCAAADVLFLPSRLDPLPNVVFDAAQNGCTTVLFTGATGFDDARYDEMSSVVRVGYGNLSAASRALLRAPRKLSWRRYLSIRGTEKQVVAQNLQLFDELRSLLTGLLRDVSLPIVANSGVSILFREEDESLARVPRHREQKRLARLRRKAIWPSVDAARSEIGEKGGWIHAKTKIEDYCDIPNGDPQFATLPPLNIHIHAHYVDDLEKDFSRFLAYRTALQIVVTTDTDAKAEKICEYAGKADVSVNVKVVPNQGRDILPFLNVVAEHKSEDAAVWCHVHQKKSVSSTVGGDQWREFLLRILLGDETRISSAVAQIAKPEVGLVTAFDPYVVGWSASRRLIPIVEHRLGRRLPDNPLLFPVGNMFWTRAGIVRSMLKVFGTNYAWPNEPLPNDGTVYHMIERLWPAVAAMDGKESVFLNRPETRRG